MVEDESHKGAANGGKELGMVGPWSRAGPRMGQGLVAERALDPDLEKRTRHKVAGVEVGEGDVMVGNNDSVGVGQGKHDRRLSDANAGGA